MNFFQTFIRFTVTILCVTKYAVAQHYDSDINYNDHSAESDAEGSPEDSGFVTPLDFAPLFGGAVYGLSGAASNPTANIFQKKPKKYQSLFDVGGAESHITGGTDFFQGQSSDKEFSPESFGFLPQFSQGLVAESVAQPKRYQEKTVEIERTKATAKSSAITRAPHSFDVETKHDGNYKRDSNSGEKSADYKAPSGTTFQAGSGNLRGVNEDHLAPYKKYSFQPQSAYVPAQSYQALAGGNSGSYPYAQLAGIDPKIFRYKRYSGNKRKQKSRSARLQKEKEEEESDYGYHGDYKSRPREFDESGNYESPDFSTFGDKAPLKKYDYGHDEEYGSDEYERIKKLSDDQAAEVKKNPEHCKKVKKDSMTCTVCLNPKTGGSYESCAYESEPKNNKYAYVKEQKFDSNDQPENQDESKNAPSTAEAPEKSEKLTEDSEKEETPSSYESPNKDAKQSSPYTSQASQPDYTLSKPVRGGAKYQPNLSGLQQPTQTFESYYSPKAESSEPIKFAAYQQPYDASNEGDNDDESDDEEEEEKSEEKDEGSSEKSDDDKNYEYKSALPGFFTDNEEKKDVESVLAEFVNKDRSACKKILKNHMTCYQCTDKSGMKHEECMFVSESAPKSSHLAYKELKEFNTKPGATQQIPGNEGAESKVVESQPSSEQLATTTTDSSTADYLAKITKNQPIKKYTSLDDLLKKGITATPSLYLPTDKFIGLYDVSSTVPSKPVGIVKREIKIVKRDTKAVNENTPLDENPSNLSELDKIADPSDFAGEESKGAFWAETVPAYDKELGVSLPRYMLEKTEQETSFDKTLSSGK